MGGHYFPIFPPLSDSNYLDRGSSVGGEGAVFLGYSPLEQKYQKYQKYQKHWDITCITYEIHVIPAVHPNAAFQGC